VGRSGEKREKKEFSLALRTSFHGGGKKFGGRDKFPLQSRPKEPIDLRQERGGKGHSGGVDRVRKRENLQSSKVKVKTNVLGECIIRYSRYGRLILRGVHSPAESTPLGKGGGKGARKKKKKKKNRERRLTRG